MSEREGPPESACNPDTTGEGQPDPLLWRRYASAVRLLRWPILLAWLALAAYVYRALPPLTPSTSGGDLSQLVSRRAPAIEAQLAAAQHFDFPLLAQVAIVQYRAHGLPASVQANAVKRALELDEGGLSGMRGIQGAIALTNASHLLPAVHKRGTTAVTYLFFSPSLGSAAELRLSSTYARRYLAGPRSGLIGITGAVAGEAAQARQLNRSLTPVEVATILLVVVVVGVALRSLVAPAVALGASAVAYVVSTRVLALAAKRAGVTVPGELTPIIVVLLLGIMTDYSVFFLSGLRDRLRAGLPRRGAHQLATQQLAPIVLTAGLTVAASLSMILTARLSVFSSLGPGLAITVLVGVIVAVTLIPALLAILGPAAYWPSRSVHRSQADPPVSRQGRLAQSFRMRLERLAVRPAIAAMLLAAGLAALLAGATPLREARVGVNLIEILPHSAPPARAARAASRGFAPGIIAPTEVLLEKAGLSSRLSGVDHLQMLLAKQSGVAGVIGPAQPLAQVQRGAFLGRSGRAVRFLVILDARPFTAAGVRELERLQRAMPGMLAKAGLSDARVRYAGDTAISQEVVGGAGGAFVRVGILTLLVDFAILALFLRALVAPLVLVAASALVVLAALGIAALVFAEPVHQAGFTFYVPLAAEVLLISFGSDYNLYLVGRIWEVSRQMAFRRAIALASGEASFAINVAGFSLASAFAMLALVGLRSFDQLALAMFAGLFIDTFLVRPLLVPAALSLLGPYAGWPGSGSGARREAQTQTQGA